MILEKNIWKRLGFLILIAGVMFTFVACSDDLKEDKVAVEEVSDISSVEVPYGTSGEDVISNYLPKTVDVKLSTGETTTGNISWAVPDNYRAASEDNPKSYTFKGTFSVEGESLTGDVEVEITVLEDFFTEDTVNISYTDLNLDDIETVTSSNEDVVTVKDDADNDQILITSVNEGSDVTITVTGTGDKVATVDVDVAEDGTITKTIEPYGIEITDIAAVVGTPKDGETLSAGELTPTGAAADYKWQYNDGSGWKDLASGESYTVDVDGDAVSEGDDIRVVAIGTGDYYGEVESAVVTIVVPETGSITGNVDDLDTGDNIEGVTVETEVDGETYLDITDANGDYTIKNVPLGEHEVKADHDNYDPTIETAPIIENDGDTVTQNFSLNKTGIDTIEIASPGENDPIVIQSGTNVSVDYNAQDTNFASAVLIVDGGPDGEIFNSEVNKGDNIEEVDTTGVSEGEYDLTLTVTDLAGNEVSVEEVGAIVIDDSIKTLPEVSSASPIHLQSNDKVTITYAADDNNVREVLMTVTNPVGTAVVKERSVDPGSGKTEEVDLSGLSDIVEGYYDVTIEITDEANNTASDTMDETFEVDASIGKASINSPTDISPAVEQSGEIVTVDYEADDKNFAEAALIVEDNGAEIFNNKVAQGTGTRDIDLSDASEGEYDVTLTVTDLAGNEVSVEEAGAIVVDDSIDTAVINSPTNTSPAVKQSGEIVTVDYEADDDNFAEAVLVVEDNGVELFNDTVSQGAGTQNIDLSGASEGEYNVTLTVTDFAGNEVSTVESGAVVVDDSIDTPVGITDVSPVLLKNSATVTIRYDADDENASEVLMTLSNPSGTAVVDERSVDAGSGKIEEIDLVGLSGIEEGNYDVTVKITDKAGNSDSDTMTEAFEVDNSIDTAVINSPTDISPAIEQSGETVTVDYEADDDNFAEAALVVEDNGEEIFNNTVAQGAGAQDIDLSGASEGEYDVILTVTDLADNEVSVAQTGAIIVDDSIDEPANAASASSTRLQSDDTVTIYYYANDAHVDEVLMTVRNPGGTAVVDERSVDPAGPYSKAEDIDLSGLNNVEEGDYDVTVKIIDKAGNSDSDTNGNLFKVDDTKPQVNSAERGYAEDEVKVWFSEAVNVDDVSKIEVVNDSTGDTYNCELDSGSGGNLAVVILDRNLDYNYDYTVTVKSGAVSDAAGNDIDTQNNTASFHY